MASIKPAINLFKGRKKNLIERLTKWALTIGRVVVILTETIALTAFLYRFSLDRQLIELHDKIKQKQALVKLLKNSEDTFRNLQERLTVSAEFSKAGKETVALYNEIVHFSATDLVFNNLFLSENQIRIDASLQSVATLTSFIKSLRENPKIESVSLDKIENKTTSATIVVSITATMKRSIAKKE